MNHSFFACPKCRFAYRAGQLVLVDRREIEDIFHGECAECKLSMLFSMKEVDGSLQVLGLPTDLRRFEILRFWQNEAISVDDVIAVHNALKLDSFIKIM